MAWETFEIFLMNIFHFSIEKLAPKKNTKLNSIIYTNGCLHNIKSVRVFFAFDLTKSPKRMQSFWGINKYTKNVPDSHSVFQSLF